MPCCFLTHKRRNKEKSTKEPEFIPKIVIEEPTISNAISNQNIDFKKSKVEELLDIKKGTKTEEQKEFLKQALNRNAFLQKIHSEQIDEMIEFMEASYPCNEVVIKEGENGDRVYILESGELDITQGSIFLKTIKGGTVFGELAIIRNCQRTATITSKSPAKIWSLERGVFQNIIMKRPTVKLSDIVANYPDLMQPVGHRSR